MFFKLIDVPLNILRDYTVPPTSEEDWNRNRAAISCITMPIALFWLNGDLFQGDTEDNLFLQIGLYWMIPGTILALGVRMCTKVT